MSAYGSSRFQSVLDDGSLAVLDSIGGGAPATQKRADENDTRVRPARQIVEQEDEEDKNDK